MITEPQIKLIDDILKVIHLQYSNQIDANTLDTLIRGLGKMDSGKTIESIMIEHELISEFYITVQTAPYSTAQEKRYRIDTEGHKALKTGFSNHLIELNNEKELKLKPIELASKSLDVSLLAVFFSGIAILIAVLSPMMKPPVQITFVVLDVVLMTIVIVPKVLKRNKNKRN